MKSKFCIPLLLLYLTACSPTPFTTRPVPFEEFNALVATAHTNDKPWTQSLIQVVLKFVGDNERARKRSIEITSLPERFSDAEVVVTREGLMDDSISGVQHRLKLHRTDRGYWQIDSATRAQKCHQDRGHTTYSSTPCQ